jgi:arginyl-tRNA synthetase
MLKQEIAQLIQKALETKGITDVNVMVDYPSDFKHGDYASNIALIAAKKLRKNPMEFAEELKEVLLDQGKEILENISVAKPGFINFTVKNNTLISSLIHLGKWEKVESTLTGIKFFIEYAHPNTHKEMHIGHMRTLITGEAVARLAEAAGADVFRANYQGDIGLHVAKALYGIQAMMEEKNLSLETVAGWNNADKAHFLGQGYALGSKEYEEQKEVIDQINKDLYSKDSAMNALYVTTRQWSLDYYDEFYARFYTKFDRLFFESEVAESGKKIVEDHIGKIFHKENGAIVFKGEEYGLHTRVFITQAGNPTYEGKEMGNAFNEYDAFKFDKKIHVVGSEQAGYFKVVFKALDLIDPEKFKDKQHHISMGMVQFADRKMSSRTGDVLRVDWLIDQVKEKVGEIMTDERVGADGRDQIVEQVAIGAIKYSVLQVGTGQNVAFDIQKSISLDGNSGPYLQYVYARTQSVLRKAGEYDKSILAHTKAQLEPEERALIMVLAKFDEVIVDAATRYSPNVLCTYLFEVAQAFNLFYQKHQIIKAEDDVKQFRLELTSSTGDVIKRGLNLMGIQAPEEM